MLVFSEDALESDDDELSDEDDADDDDVDDSSSLSGSLLLDPLGGSGSVFSPWVLVDGMCSWSL